MARRPRVQARPHGPVGLLPGGHDLPDGLRGFLHAKPQTPSPPEREHAAHRPLNLGGPVPGHPRRSSTNADVTPPAIQSPASGSARSVLDTGPGESAPSSCEKAHANLIPVFLQRTPSSHHASTLNLRNRWVGPPGSDVGQRFEYNGRGLQQAQLRRSHVNLNRSWNCETEPTASNLADCDS